MAKRDSVQKRLQKVRPPRVQMTYDVERGDAIEQKELPFVVGVIGDFAGSPASANPLPRIKDRKFVNIDLDNFDDVMAGMEPRMACRVKNTLNAEAGTFAIDLSFARFEDFCPEAVVNKIEPLRKLMEARAKLADLRNKLAGNDRLEDLLGEVLSNTEQLERLERESDAGDKS